MLAVTKSEPVLYLLEFTHLTGPSRVGVRLQEAVDKVLGVLADILPVTFMEDDTATLALLDQICQTLATEWRVTAKERVGDDSQRPHVYGLAVSLLHHDLGRCVSERSGHGSQLLSWCVQHLGDAKVGKHQGRVFIAG